LGTSLIREKACSEMHAGEGLLHNGTG
jgi:hypothetical protein